MIQTRQESAEGSESGFYWQGRVGKKRELVNLGWSEDSAIVHQMGWLSKNWKSGRGWGKD